MDKILPDAGSTSANVYQWPEWPPKELALGLAGALQYQDCRVDDLWEEVRNWLSSNSVPAPDAHKSGPVATPEQSSDHTKYKHVSQAGSTMQLTRLVYTSRHAGLHMADFDQILKKSLRNNQRDHITGALIINENSFMQLLEGNRAAIGQCLMRITQDKRHGEIQIVSCGDVQKRLFMEWDMHLIMASRVKKEIMSMYHINGAFRPNQMSEFAIEDLCRTLSEGKWDAEAA